MSEMRDERTDIVRQISKINFSGNIIPDSWLQAILLPGGAPDLTSIFILSEIVYWYRDYEMKDEDTGRVVERKKKFRGDMLQRSYESFSKQFGFKKSSVQASIKSLRDKNLVRIEFRTITMKNGIKCNNVLFIEPIPKSVASISFPRGPMAEKLGEGPLEKLVDLQEKNSRTNKSSTETSTQSTEDIKSSSRFEPPTPSEVQAYMEEIGMRNPRSASGEFVDHYQARGWKPKGYTTQMKDWRAAARTWKRHQDKFDSSGVRNGFQNSAEARTSHNKRVLGKFLGTGDREMASDLFGELSSANR